MKRKREALTFKITDKRENKGYAQALRDIAKQGADQATTHLAVLASDIADTLDTNNAGDRAKIKSAVSGARGILLESSKGVAVFDAWKALGVAHGDAGFQTISEGTPWREAEAYRCNSLGQASARGP